MSTDQIHQNITHLVLSRCSNGDKKDEREEEQACNVQSRQKMWHNIKMGMGGEWEGGKHKVET